jgi:hypothetical protein
MVNRRITLAILLFLELRRNTQIPITPEMAETAHRSPRLLRVRSTLDRRNRCHRQTCSGTTAATNSSHL